jgi:hypothetical protein
LTGASTGGLNGNSTSGLTSSNLTGGASPNLAPLPATYSTLSYGAKSETVKGLQIFLNTRGFFVAQGINPGARGYETNYFGPATLNALNRYRTALNSRNTSGLMGGNAGGSLASGSFAGANSSSTQSLGTSTSRLGKTFRFYSTFIPFTTNSNVKNLQIFLNDLGFTVAKSGPGSKGQETMYFGNATKAALIRFQEYYSTEILKPVGLTKGTGNFGPSTIKKMNRILSELYTF